MLSRNTHYCYREQFLSLYLPLAATGLSPGRHYKEPITNKLLPLAGYIQVRSWKGYATQGIPNMYKLAAGSHEADTQTQVV